MSVLNDRCYSGVNEKLLLAQAQAENPDGFEILSMQKTGFLWWQKTKLIVRPLPSNANQEMRKIRLVSAIYSQREQRHHAAAQQDVMSHAHDSNQHPHR